MRYSQEVHEFIAENVTKYAVKELAEIANQKFGTEFTESKMRCYKANHKLKSGRPTGTQKGSSRLYPPEVRTFIIDNHKGTTPDKMAAMVNEKFGTGFDGRQISAYYKNNKLRSGVSGCFKKGHIPQNKGIKGICPKGCEAGWFKKGHTPRNHKPVSSERIDSKDGYTLIKVQEPNVWRLKHNEIWQQHHGPIPDGHVVIFMDGDRGHIDIDNLALVTTGEHCTLNKKRLRSSNPDLTQAGILITRISARRSSLARKAVGNERNDCKGLG